MQISFTVLGAPVPQGSMKAFVPKGWTRAVLTSDNKKLKPWRQQVGGTALAVMKEQRESIIPRGTGVSITVLFFFEKPASAKKYAVAKTTKPDIDKLLRGLFDALTGIVFEDDSQIVLCQASKLFGQPAKTEITVTSE